MEERCVGGLVEVDGVSCAGIHVLIELWNADGLDKSDLVEDVMKKCISSIGAELLNLVGHSFGPGLGVTYVALLSESHMSVHTWPERKYASIDVYTCGSCDPRLCLPVLEKSFPGCKVEHEVYYRGVPK